MSSTDDDAAVAGSPGTDAGQPGGPDLAEREISAAPGGSVGAGPEPEVRRSRRAAVGPVDAPSQGGAERESQARARNREALRAFRALAESPPDPGDDGARVETPTRRQRRLLQAKGQPAVEAPEEGADASSSSGTGESSPGVPLPGGRRERRREETAQNAAVAAVRREPASQDLTEPASEPASESTSEPVSRPTVTDGSTDDVGSRVSARNRGEMSVEEALAARTSLAEAAAAHATALRESGRDNPFEVNLEVLAQQKALAERAAVLTSRARRMQELSEQNRRRRSVVHDPTTPHNLSIVTPNAGAPSPGDSATVLRAPITSHIPLVMQPLGADRTAGLAVGADTGPVGARSAFGLEPLDAETAGLGRVRRLRLLQYSLLGAGAVALTTGIIMTVSSLNG